MKSYKKQKPLMHMIHGKVYLKRQIVFNLKKENTQKIIMFNNAAVLCILSMLYIYMQFLETIEQISL